MSTHRPGSALHTEIPENKCLQVDRTPDFKTEGVLKIRLEMESNQKHSSSSPVFLPVFKSENTQCCLKIKVQTERRRKAASEGVICLPYPHLQLWPCLQIALQFLELIASNSNVVSVSGQSWMTSNTCF